MKRALAVATAVGLLAAGPAPAQDALGALIEGQGQALGAAPPAEAESTLVESLIVTSIRPGPAVWKVADADSVVWVMGIPDALPETVEWNRAEFRAHLRGSNVLINGAGGISINPLDIFRILFTMNRFVSDRPLDQAIRPELWARFDAAYQSIDGPNARQQGRDRENFLRLKPSYAAFMLSGIFQRSLGMENGQPEGAVAREARFRVRTERVGRSGAIDILRIIENMPIAQAEVCIEDAIEEVEAGRERALEAARGWARGDLRVALSAERGFERCVAGYPEIAAETRRNNQAVAAAILGALQRPGKSVAVVDLRPLLASDGILVRLMATPGVTVTAPDVPGLEGEIGYQPEDFAPAADEAEAATVPAA